MTETGLEIDTEKLKSYLRRELDTNVNVTETEVLEAGLNFHLTVSTDKEEDKYILRRPNKLRQKNYINELKQEYEVMERLQDTSIKTPSPVLFCEDDSIIGDSFFVMTYLEGDTVPLGSDLPRRFQNPESRRKVSEELIDTLADIHSLDVGKFKDVCEHQTVKDQITRSINQLKTATEVTGHDASELWSVADWLQENIPTDPEISLTHGDFRPSNVLFKAGDEPEIAAVLDWETAKISDPLIDLGYLLLRWRDDNDPTPSLDKLEERYPDKKEETIQDLRELNKNGLSPFTSKPGSLSRKEIVSRYEGKTGIEFENQRFYRALAPFMLATVWEDLHKDQIESGNESEQDIYVDYISIMANSIIEGEFEL